MELEFTFVSEDLEFLGVILETAFFSKMTSRNKIVGWSRDGATLKLHTAEGRCEHAFPVPLDPGQVTVLARAWVHEVEPEPDQHLFDVTYAKGYCIDGRPFDEDVHVSVVEVEYHK